MRNKTTAQRVLMLVAFVVAANLFGKHAEAQPGIPINIDVAIDKAVRKKIDDLASVMQQSLQTLSDAIPGGRYTRLIEDLHGGDPQKKVAAQAFLTSLAGLDPAIKYEVSVWFEFEPKKPLHALTFRAAIPSQDEIVTRYKQAFILNAGDVSSTPLGGPGPDEIRKEVSAAVRRALGKLDQIPDRTVRDVKCPPYRGDMIDPCPMEKAENQKRAAALQEQAALELASAFDAFYREWPIPLEAGVLTEPWPLFDERQTLFILIPEEDWQAYNNDKDKPGVRALLHKKGDQKSPLPGVQLQTFTTDEWQPIHLEDSTRPPRDFRWAVRTMTDTNLLSSSTVAQVRAIREALAKWEELNRPPGK